MLYLARIVLSLLNIAALVYTLVKSSKKAAAVRISSDGYEDEDLLSYQRQMKCLAIVVVICFTWSFVFPVNMNERTVYWDTVSHTICTCITIYKLAASSRP